MSEATEATFAADVLQSPVPVLIQFWAPWCRPCRILLPALDWLASSFADRARVMRVNSDLNRRLAERLNVRALPTIMIFVNGEVHTTILGVRPAEEYARHLERALSR